MPFVTRFDEADDLQREIDRHPLLKGVALRQVRDHFRLRLTWASLALEGNSLTEAETGMVVEEGIAVGGKPLKDQCEAVGHAEAFDCLLTLTGRPDLAEGDIRKLHRLLLRRTDPASAGRYRRRDTIIADSTSVFPAPGELKGLMAALVAELPRLRAKRHPVEFAALLHLRLLAIHPFVDGNGRVARLLMNRELLQAGYPVTVIPPDRRPEYLAGIRSGDAGDAAPFLDLLLAMVLESQRDFLRLLRSLKGNSSG